MWTNQWYTLCTLWKKLGRNSTRTLSKKFFSGEQFLSMIPSREIPLHSSRLPSQRYYQRRGRWKYYRTMWHCSPALYRNVELSEWPQWILCPWYTIIPSFSLWFWYAIPTRYKIRPTALPWSIYKTEPPSTYDCKVLDGSAIVHCLPTFNVSTFNMYADKKCSSLQCPLPGEAASGH